MKRRRLLSMFTALGLCTAVLSGCISDSTRGWSAPVEDEGQQYVSSTRGKLDGISAATNATPVWTGELTQPLGQQDTRLLSITINPTDTPFLGDLIQIDSEIVRVRSLNINGAEREMVLDRGFAGTVASPHAAGAKLEAVRRAWRFPDDWHIREGDARGLGGIYATPVLDSTGTLYVGDYDGWVYAFKPGDVNLDAANDDQEPDTALVDLGKQIVGGLALDETSGRLYVAADDTVYAIDTNRLQASLTAGGGVTEPEPGFSFSAGDAIWGAPVIDGDSVYVSSLDGKLYSLDPASGAVNWTFDAGRSLATTPVLDGDLVLVAGFDSRLYALNKNDGTEVWEYIATNWILSTPVIADGTAYFGDFDSILHAVDVQSGNGQWTIPLARGKIRAAAAVVDGFVVLGTDDGWLLGVSLDTEALAWEVELETDIRADLIASSNEVLLAPDDCQTLPGGDFEIYYRAIDPSTGTLKRVDGIC